ncbi:MAG: periplasmic heavy metal sensor [Burkholderiales bacterium]
MKRWDRERKLTLLLIVSIVANVFFASAIAGWWIGGRSQTLQAARNLNEVLSPLPEAKRALVLTELRAVLPDMKKDFAALQAARELMADAFSQPELDQANIDRQFAEIRARTAALQMLLQEAFRRAAGAMTQAERQAVLRAIERRELKALPDI